MIIKLGAIATLSVAGLSLFALQSGSRAGTAGVAIAADAASQTKSASETPAMIPARRLDCVLGRIANFDPKRVQEPSEFVFEGRHTFSMFLPATPVRTTSPPDPIDMPEPVDPQTRIIADPDGLASDSEGHPFDRVVDVWPDRVEMTRPINSVAVTLIIVDAIDQTRSTAAIFLTKANDAATFDLNSLYHGQCGVTLSMAGKAPA